MYQYNSQHSGNPGEPQTPVLSPIKTFFSDQNKQSLKFKTRTKNIPYTNNSKFIDAI